MELSQLIYMSALVDPALETVNDILVVSARNDKHRDITGMVLYSDGDIVQVLEGDLRAVRDTFNCILFYTRHVGVQVHLEQEVASRHFSA
jgi:hypothetical protein